MSLYDALGNYKTIKERQETLESYNKEYGENLEEDKFTWAYDEFVTKYLEKSLLSALGRYTRSFLYLDFPVQKIGEFDITTLLREFCTSYNIGIPYKDNVQLLGADTIEDLKHIISACYMEIQRVNYYELPVQVMQERLNEELSRQKELYGAYVNENIGSLLELFPHLDSNLPYVVYFNALQNLPDPKLMETDTVRAVLKNDLLDKLNLAESARDKFYGDDKEDLGYVLHKIKAKK